MAVKKPNNTIKKEPVSFRLGPKTAKEMLSSWRERGYSEAQREEIKKLFWEWGQRDQSLQFVEFYHLIGIVEQNWSALRKKYPDFEEMHSHVRDLIGLRRERILWEKDPRSMNLTMRLYSGDHRTVYEEDKEARKDISQAGAGNIELVFDGVRQTDVVPEKEAAG